MVNISEIWTARETTVKLVLASSVSIDSSTALDTEFTNASATAISGKMKNVTVVFPESDVEGVNLLGVDASSFQNMELDKKPWTLAELTGTLIIDGDELIEPFIDGTAVAISTTHERYQVGNNNRPEIAAIVTLTDATEYVNFVLDNAWMTKLGDAKIDSADGHWEIDISIKCKPADFFWEYKK